MGGSGEFKNRPARLWRTRFRCEPDSVGPYRRPRLYVACRWDIAAVEQDGPEPMTAARKTSRRLASEPGGHVGTPILVEQPAELFTISVGRHPLDDQVPIRLQIELRQRVFLEARGEVGGHHVPATHLGGSFSLCFHSRTTIPRGPAAGLVFGAGSSGVRDGRPLALRRRRTTRRPLRRPSFPRCGELIRDSLDQLLARRADEEVRDRSGAVRARDRGSGAQEPAAGAVGQTVVAGAGVRL